MTFALILFWEPCTSRRKKLNLILPVMLYLEFKILQHINTAIKVILTKKKKKLFAARNQIMNNKDRIKILVQKLKIKIKL